MSRTCAGDCGQEAKMQCPTCIKLSLSEGSFFCSQDCFKKNWPTHKLVHKAVEDTLPKTFPGFEFTGPQRPYAQSPIRKVPEHIKRPDYADHPEGYPAGEYASKVALSIKALRPAEIEGMRLACKYAREVLDEAARAVAVGVTCDEIDRVVHEACIARNCYPSPLNYRNFPKSCCTSVNEVICHGIPDMYRLKDGDIVNLDISVYHNGYHGDVNETFLVGTVDEAGVKLVRATAECLQLAIEACKPGFRYRDVGTIISKHAHAAGLSVVRTYCGHGINDLFHTTPSIPHYAKNKAVGVMQPGHTFTIEPMINEGVWQDVHWPDGWTATTKDGKRSAQFEHTLLITDTGCEVLTARLPGSPSGPAWYENRP